MDSKDLERIIKDMAELSKENNPYQCKIWSRLKMDAIKDLDNRTVRRELLEHPFNCSDKSCIELATTLRGIMK